MKISKYQLVLILFLFSAAVFGQKIERDVIGSAGNRDANAKVIVEWTLGEVMTETYASAGVLLTQGFHQPIASVIGIEDQFSTNSGLIKIYPNPAREVVYIEADPQVSIYAVRLYDVTGREVYHEVFSSSLSKLAVPLNDRAEGTYLIKIESDQGRSYSLHKIIKK